MGSIRGEKGKKGKKKSRDFSDGGVQSPLFSSRGHLCTDNLFRDDRLKTNIPHRTEEKEIWES